MVKSAQSEARKRKLKRRDYERNVAAAVKDYKTAKATGAKTTYKSVANSHGVKWKTVQEHVKNNRPFITAAREDQRNLNDAEEDKLSELLLYMAGRGVPLSAKQISQRANELVRSRLGLKARPVGQNWVQRYMARRPELKMHWGSRIDNGRATALNPHNNADYWEVVGEIIKNKNIPPRHIYGSDEVGFMLGYAPRRRVVGPTGTSIQHDKQDGAREMITVFNTICANGSVLRPTAIYANVNYQASWTKQGNPLGMA